MAKGTRRKASSPGTRKPKDPIAPPTSPTGAGPLPQLPLPPTTVPPVVAGRALLHNPRELLPSAVVPRPNAPRTLPPDEEDEPEEENLSGLQRTPRQFRSWLATQLEGSKEELLVLWLNRRIEARAPNSKVTIEELRTTGRDFLDEMSRFLGTGERDALDIFLARVVAERIEQGMAPTELRAGIALLRDILLQILVPNLPAFQRHQATAVIYLAFEEITAEIFAAAIAVLEGRVAGLQQLQDNLLLNLEESVVLEDPSGIMTFANPKLSALTGYAHEELIGSHWRTIIAPDFWPTAEQQTRARRQGVKGRYQAAVLTKDNRRIPVIVSATPLFTGDRLEGVLTVVSDIRELKSLQTELELSRDKLREANDELARRASQLEHDNEVLRQRLELPADQAAAAHRVGLPEGGRLYHLRALPLAMRLGQQASARGSPVLIVSRHNPVQLRERVDLRGATVVWLTSNRVPDVRCIDPSALVDLSSLLLRFIGEGKGGLLVLDGLEYLFSTNEFRTVLNLVQLLNDKVALSDAAVLILLDQATVPPREAQLLLHEMTPLEDAGTT